MLVNLFVIKKDDKNKQNEFQLFELLNSISLPIIYN